MLLRRCACILVLLVAFMHLSCGKKEKVEYQPTDVDSQRLEEVLASRQQENPPPLTLLEGYQIALARAREWDKDAYLTLIQANLGEQDAPYKYYFGAYGTSGIGCLKLDEGVYWSLVRVNTHSGEIEYFKSEGISEVNTEPVDGIDNWVLDSPQAIEIAEDNGGKAFKEKYPQYKLIIETTTFFPPTEWVLEYWMSDGKGQGAKSIIASFRIVIDPYDGSFRIVEDTDGVSGKVIE